MFKLGGRRSSCKRLPLSKERRKRLYELPLAVIRTHVRTPLSPSLRPFLAGRSGSFEGSLVDVPPSGNRPPCTPGPPGSSLVCGRRLPEAPPRVHTPLARISLERDGALRDMIEGDSALAKRLCYAKTRLRSQPLGADRTTAAVKTTPPSGGGTAKIG